MRKALLICGILFFAYSTPLYSYDGRIRTEIIKDIDGGKTYLLILYGARHLNDLESVVILDIEGDGYTFEPYAPDFDYSIERGLDYSRAINMAEGFISWHPLYQRSELRRITLSGIDIGYELRPLYDPLPYGQSDVLDIDYRLRDHKVIVKIRLLPQIEQMLFDGDRVREREGN